MTKAYFPTAEARLSPHTIATLCAGFITIDHGRFKLSHYSMLECLQRHKTICFPSAVFVVTKTITSLFRHATLMEKQWLQDTPGVVYKMDSQTLAFLEYCSEFWTTHVRGCPADVQLAMIMSVQESSNHLPCSGLSGEPYEGLIWQDLSLLIAITCNLSEAVQRLEQSGASLVPVGCQGVTPFQTAFKAGRIHAARDLLNAGAADALEAVSSAAEDDQNPLFEEASDLIRVLAKNDDQELLTQGRRALHISAELNKIGRAHV